MNKNVLELYLNIINDTLATLAVNDDLACYVDSAVDESISTFIKRVNGGGTSLHQFSNIYDFFMDKTTDREKYIIILELVKRLPSNYVKIVYERVYKELEKRNGH